MASIFEQCLDHIEASFLDMTLPDKEGMPRLDNHRD
jgi:hypothetical protein